MKLSEFQYHLPKKLIAQKPLKTRSSSRLLMYQRASNKIEDVKVASLPGFLDSGDLLVFNDTKVIPARLIGKKETGGKIEVLIEQITDANTVIAQLGNKKNIKVGANIIFANGSRANIRKKKDIFYELTFNDHNNIHNFIEEYGIIPLPPYIKRQVSKEDRDRYQTIYAKESGAVAAPTAGLHFDKGLFSKLASKNINRAYITLHVGAGTFLPMSTEDIKQHVMHEESFKVTQETCDAIIACKERGNKVIAVGTTTARALETIGKNKPLKEFYGKTNLFIYPGFKFNIIDGLMTNFHLPCSTLLAMVCAFSETKKILAIYEHAVEQKYRFYSYGDTMLIL